LQLVCVSFLWQKKNNYSLNQNVIGTAKALRVEDFANYIHGTQVIFS